jgi:hypothetical protein
MPRIDYDRYELYRNDDDTVNQLPFVKLPINPSDKYTKWIEGDRLDRLAMRFYGNPFYDFLILYANPEYLSEFDIPYETVLRIPFPLEKAKND